MRSIEEQYVAQAMHYLQHLHQQGLMYNTIGSVVGFSGQAVSRWLRGVDVMSQKTALTITQFIGRESIDNKYIDQAIERVHLLYELGLSKSAIARLTGSAQSTVKCWLTGQHRPRLEVALRILEIDPEKYRDSRLHDHVLLEEWPHMCGLLGETGAVFRLASAYRLTPSAVRWRARKLNLLQSAA